MKYYRICLANHRNEQWVYIDTCLDDNDRPEDIVNLVANECDYAWDNDQEGIEISDFSWICDCDCEECCNCGCSDNDNVAYSSHRALSEKPKHIDFTSYLTINGNVNPECKLTESLFEVEA